jgi:hypothetical protein
MNTKNILGLILLLFTQIVYAQKVGINTDTPLTTLDVNGAIQVRKDIKLGGSAGTSGSPGGVGQAFTSQGAGKSPVWSPMGIDVSMGFGITQSISLSDRVGVKYLSEDDITTLGAEYLEDSELSTANGWTEITGLRTEIRPAKSKNKVVIALQTIAQALANAHLADAEFAIGIFVDGKLKSVRPVNVFGSGTTFTGGSLFDTFDNLPVKENDETYVIQVATALRFRHVYIKGGVTGGTAPTGSAWHVIIGCSSTSVTNTNDWMNETSLKVDLYEEIN